MHALRQPHVVLGVRADARRCGGVGSGAPLTWWCALSPPLGGVLAGYFGDVVPFYVAAVAVGLDACGQLLFWRSHRTDGAPADPASLQSERGFLGGTAAAEAGGGEKRGCEVCGVLSLLRDSQVAVVAMGNALSNFCVGAMEVGEPPHPPFPAPSSDRNRCSVVPTARFDTYTSSAALVAPPPARACTRWAQVLIPGEL